MQSSTLNLHTAAAAAAAAAASKQPSLFTCFLSCYTRFTTLTGFVAHTVVAAKLERFFTSLCVCVCVYFITPWVD